MNENASERSSISNVSGRANSDQSVQRFPTRIRMVRAHVKMFLATAWIHVIFPESLSMQSSGDIFELGFYFPLIHLSLIVDI